ncbi:hypothetical protein [Bacillus sp. 03113]|uniref:hypothetical protein n=1 Tax=Bacillus sp. 03113 TaxID=2578211 RepID=UPI001145186A|nr:hypothetical protein [Bacillus sp. 03113]
MNIKKVVSSLILILILISLINGAFPQLQIALFGDVVIPTVSVKIIMFGFLFFSLFFSFQYKNKTKIILIWWIFLLYLFLNFIRLLSIGYSVSEILIGYNGYYALIFFMPMFFFLEKSISINKISSVLLFLAVPVSVLGIFQYVLKEPLLATSSPNGSFYVSSFKYIMDDSGSLQSFRAFSLFDSGLSFGFFLCICLSVVFSKFLIEKGHKFFYFIVIILFATATYMTLTRNIYICFLLTILSVMLINKKSKVVKYLPFIHLAIGYAIYYFAPKITMLFSSSLVDNRTLLIRQANWISVKNVWFKDVWTFLFGSGVYQNGNSSYNLILDNNYLALGMHIGLVGLLFWFFIMMSIWNYCLKIVRASHNSFNMGITSFLSTFLVTGIYNINIQIYLLVFACMIIGDHYIKFEKEQNLNVVKKKRFFPRITW